MATKAKTMMIIFIVAGIMSMLILAMLLTYMSNLDLISFVHMCKKWNCASIIFFTSCTLITSVIGIGACALWK